MIGHIPPTIVRRLRTAAAAAALVLLAGCGGADYELVPVSGRVLLDGQPLAGAHLTFQPVGGQPGHAPLGPGAVGVTDATGYFSLQSIDGQRGAVAGEHRMVITTARSQSENPHDDFATYTPELAPAAYRNGQLRFEVPVDGTAAADFLMSSSPAPPVR